MCTISWLAEKGRLHVYFNRDERKDREAALPPSIYAGNHDAFIAPIDPRGGGTWIAVTASGTVYALLNHYDCPALAAENALSRGQIPYRLAAGTWNLTNLLNGNISIARMAPFHLMVISAENATRHTWNGVMLETISAAHPIGSFTTSSWNAEEVRASRNAAFSNCFKSIDTPNTELLERYHDGLETPEEPAASVLMDRPLSRTVSQTRIVISEKETTVTYRARNPEDQLFPQQWAQTHLATAHA